MSHASPAPAADSLFARRSRPKSVRVKNVRHWFGHGEACKQVLFDNNLDIAEGEIVIVTGPSGSGKTTLLTLIGTLRQVQEGSLVVLGRELHGATPAQMNEARKDLGFIFQAHNLFESLTAFENVSMSTQLAGIPRDEAAERIERLLSRLELGHRIHYKPKQLSGGQKQRVAIARGLVHNPKIILADEPTAALDQKTGREVVTIFQELAREHRRTIIMVTHDNRILDVADRIVTLVDGRIVSSVDVVESVALCESLKGFPLFAELTPGTLANVADSMTMIEFPAGSIIVREGDRGDLFYVIGEGKVEVVSESTQERIAELGAGNYFGEIALLQDRPRTATVRAIDDTLCYSLSKEKFQETLSNSASFNEELRNALTART